MALLRVAVELLEQGGIPEPVAVQASGQFGLTFGAATKDALRAWAALLGVEVRPWHATRFEWNGVPHTMWNVTGLWCGTVVGLHCTEPLDMAAGSEVAR